MKIIDEKGRLFSKINIIDLLAILFLLSLTPMFYFSYRIIAQAKARPEYVKKAKIITDVVEEKNKRIEGRRPDILERRVINFEDKLIVLENRLDLLEKYAKETYALTHKDIAGIDKEILSINKDVSDIVGGRVAIKDKDDTLRK